MRSASRHYDAALWSRFVRRTWRRITPQSTTSSMRAIASSNASLPQMATASALDGETIRINARTVAHRAVARSPRARTAALGGCRTLSGNEVFLMGDTPDSFDSRYFGPVSADDIEGVWRQVF